MRRFGQVFRFELLRQVKRRGYLFMTFGVPLLAVVLVFGIQLVQNLASANEEDVPAVEDDFADFNLNAGAVGYVDQSGLFQDQGLFAAYLLLFGSEEDARIALEAGDIQTYYVVPADYLETGEVTRYVPSFGLEGIVSDRFFRRFVIDSLLDDATENISNRLQDPLDLHENRVIVNGDAGEVQVDEAKSEGASFILVYLFSFMLLFGTFFTSGYLMQSVVEEKESRMVEILLATMRPGVLLAGKVLSLGSLGLAQIMVWLVTGIFLLGRLGAIFPDLVDLGVRFDTVAWTLVYFVIGYLFFAAVYAVIGAIAPSMREGPQLAVVITLPAALPFYFTAIITESPHGTLATIFSLFPLTAPLTMVQRLSIATVPIGEILLSLSLLAISAVGMTWLAGRIFRVSTLLAGQLPRWRDLVRIVREG